MWINTEPPGGIEDNIGGKDSLFLEEGDGSGYWAMVGNTYYVRDVTGKEIAVYNSGGLVSWNLWGMDQIGHMNADTTKYYYLKDHLGSTSAVINSTKTVVSAQDYDAWGYIMDNRTYESQAVRYKFTGKERDNGLESNYDYFGARYYDSRIANWLSVDPLMEKHFDYTPYNYVLRSPIILIDPNGRQENINQAILQAHEWVIENPWIFIVAPEIPVVGPAGLGILALPPPERIMSNKGSKFTIGAEGYLEALMPTEVINVFAESNEINIPEENKIATELLNPPEKRGKAPTSVITGNKVEIHHIGQKKGGAFKEMFEKEHRGSR